MRCRRSMARAGNRERPWARVLHFAAAAAALGREAAGVSREHGAKRSGGRATGGGSGSGGRGRIAAGGHLGGRIFCIEQPLKVIRAARGALQVVVLVLSDVTSSAELPCRRRRRPSGSTGDAGTRRRRLLRGCTPCGDPRGRAALAAASMSLRAQRRTDTYARGRRHRRHRRALRPPTGRRAISVPRRRRG
eukprot:225716-Chlamydomonas_euryale.AAC.1